MLRSLVGSEMCIRDSLSLKRLANRFKDKSDKNSTETFNEVGYPIVLDSASNMSFGALIFSNFIPVQFVGGLMVFAMLATSVGTLTLLASLTEILKKKQIL